MNPTPLISVVVPALNMAEWIGETLSSVQNQTFSRFEIIVVDDGSTDETVGVVSRMAAHDSRITLHKNEHSLGTAAARDKGIEVSRGQYIAIIDADDIWHPDKLAVQLNKFRNSSLSVMLVYSPCRLIDQFSNVITTPPVMLLEGRCMLQLLMHNPARNGSSYLFKREVWERVEGFGSSLMKNGNQGCEDNLFLARVASISHIAATKEILVGYRRVPGSQSADKIQMYNSRVNMLDCLSVQHGIPEKVYSWSLIHSRVRVLGVELIRNKKVLRFIKKYYKLVANDFFGSIAALKWGIRRCFEDHVYFKISHKRKPFQDFDPLESANSRISLVVKKRIAVCANLESK